MLINITGGPDTSIIDINEAAQLITAAADPDANIIFGAGIDENMKDEVKITVIATGFEKTPFAADKKKNASAFLDNEEEVEPRRERPARSFDDAEVSPIFERKQRPANRERRYEDPDREYDAAGEGEPRPRRSRVYSDDSPESRTQARRGFTPDVPSFMKRKSDGNK